MGVGIQFEYSWLIFGIYTVAHYYTSTLLIRSLNSLLKSSNSKEKNEMFNEITLNGGVFVRGMIPRLEPNKARMSGKDLTAWLSHLAAILLFLAILPFDKNKVSIIGFATALVITYLNWIIGSKWALKLSELKN